MIVVDLTKITNPSFLKTLDKEQMTELAKEIRKFLIENLSVTGGHIGPNLGVVELTMALHK
ncbi:1-deoxy-D-xylulose-5-phosphate synthase N-terminal domain-containing protein, partial [Escherichia coli]|uniref:1-deoxy-D-xylulose-5-phosphate synthase N-terminal domain-containing protein n=1 Tax=Escherichia coli TaxID=562 RepID=UPI0034D3749A